ncbi:MAG: hypothetical protein K2X27_04200 [Candidatus Obscuribacterales bacterium]|nr:hypothetical protein [Candidatus Obscuribacterales bacterium]
MNSRKITFLGLTLLLLATGTFFGVRALLNHTPAKPAVVSSWEPQIPGAPPLLLMNESSGQLSNIVHRDPKSNEITSVEVGYNDGRTGVYSFQNGKLRSYKGFDDSKRLSFEGDYDLNGLLDNYRSYRSDGSVATRFQRLLDGTEEHIFYNKKGLAIKTVSTARDGSQTITERPDPSKPATVKTVKAEAAEQGYGPISTEDGQSFRLKVKTIGARVSEWESRDVKGNLQHSGKVNDKGEIELTIYVQGKAAMKQVWSCVGEDWARRIYALRRIEGFGSDGSIAAVITLRADGKTPERSDRYYNGSKQSSDYFDERGFNIASESYDSNGNPYYRNEIPPQYRRQAQLPPQLLSEPQDASGPCYRLQGVPYASPVPAEGYTVNPLFVLPN